MQIIDYHMSVTREWPDVVDEDAVDWSPILDVLEERPDVISVYAHSTIADRREGEVTQRTNVFVRTENPGDLSARDISESLKVSLMSVAGASRVKERAWHRQDPGSPPSLHHSAQQMLETNRR